MKRRGLLLWAALPVLAQPQVEVEVESTRRHAPRWNRCLGWERRW
ncbi:hypothetical protein ACG02S_04865 [Roseateles sp. DC23W]|uniref:Uncharacterized protein n=1 Tax=Pelomonas dachongensis TaxID=3299029 RepID=A0ABW7EIF0_9BURK